MTKKETYYCDVSHCPQSNGPKLPGLPAKWSMLDDGKKVGYICFLHSRMMMRMFRVRRNEFGKLVKSQAPRNTRFPLKKAKP